MLIKGSLIYIQVCGSTWDKQGFSFITMVYIEFILAPLTNQKRLLVFCALQRDQILHPSLINSWVIAACCTGKEAEFEPKTGSFIRYVELSSWNFSSQVPLFWLKMSKNTCSCIIFQKHDPLFFIFHLKQPFI